MTLLLQQNLGTAWGATVGPSYTGYYLPMMGVGQWISWLAVGLSVWALV